MSKIYAVQGDDLPRVTVVITDANDVPIPITGCTGAVVYMRKVGSTDIQTIATTVDVPTSTVVFDFSGGVLAEHGSYEAEIELDFAGLKQTTYKPLKITARPQFG